MNQEVKMHPDGYRVDVIRGVVFNRYGAPTGSLTKLGYLRSGITVDGKIKCRLVHRIVWEAAHGEVPAGLCINHINGVKTDNRIENLEVLTNSENTAHAYRLGLACNKGQNHPRSKLTDSEVLEIVRRASEGESKTKMAREFGISLTHIKRVSKRRVWTHVLKAQGESGGLS